MAIFPRRQIQKMLNEVGPWLTEAKARDLVNRLDHQHDADQVIPAEYELAIGWGLSKLVDFRFEPRVGTRDPDFYARDLFPGHDAIIEVAAISNDGLSGEPAMERTANIINGYANSIRKDASKHLYYEFMETSGYTPAKPGAGQTWGASRYFRKRLTSPGFKLEATHKDQIRNWLQTWPTPNNLHLSGEGTEVTISWKEWVHPRIQVFSSMPALTHSLTDNPVYRRLKEKEKQLKDTPDGTMRCVFLGDAGCRLLHEPNTHDSLRRQVSGKDIILHFLKTSSVDLVAVFSPRRKRENGADHHNNPRLWHLFIFDKLEREAAFYERLNQLNQLLPAPRLHGGQARSWLQQGMLNPQGRGQYKPLQITGGRSGMTVKIPARGLLELLAGRITAQEFHQWITRDNYFEHWLKIGFAISDATFESSGLDSDDDYICLHLAKDPNASPLEAPSEIGAKLGNK